MPNYILATTPPKSGKSRISLAATEALRKLKEREPDGWLTDMPDIERD